MPEKPRNRPPARSHKQQTADRRNGQPQKPIAPEILSQLHKTGSPSMIRAIAEHLANYGGILDWPSLNDILGRQTEVATPPDGSYEGSLMPRNFNEQMAASKQVQDDLLWKRKQQWEYDDRLRERMFDVLDKGYRSSIKRDI